MSVLDVVERIHRLDTIRVQLVENKTDSGTSGKLCTGELLVVTLQNGAVLVAELGDDIEDDVGTVSKKRLAKL